MAVTAGKKSGSEKLIFRVRPRLLTLLGDQLIKDANLAVFELVKNAYDADATVCAVTLEHPTDQSKARITVEDDGIGMDEDTLRNVWMVIATDFRAVQRNDERRTKKFHRFPLGEKGLGRLSAHKLGHSIRLITRRRGGEELVLDLIGTRSRARPTWKALALSWRFVSPKRSRAINMARASKSHG